MDAKKRFSPTRSDKNIQELRNEPERQLGSLRGVIDTIRRDDDTPSADSIGTHLSGMPTVQRAPALLALQQTHGNRYVQRVVAGIQAKLVVGRPGDIYEQEADRVADAVMRMPEPEVQQQAEEELVRPKLAVNAKYSVQRQVDKEDEEEEELQTKAISGKSPEVSDDLQARLNLSKGGGHALPDSTNIFMSNVIGADFSDVRMHTDNSAVQMNQDMQTKAFTHGNDIYFNRGQYNQNSENGKHLLAHELTHTVQQEGKPNIQRKIEVNPGLKLDTEGYTHSKSGDVYTCPGVAKGSLFHEIFTSLLFSPRVFKLKGTTNEEINKSFSEHRAAGYGIVNFASKKRYTFGAGSAFKMNPKYWIVDSSGIRLKPGADQQEAIDDLMGS